MATKPKNNANFTIYLVIIHTKTTFAPGAYGTSLLLRENFLSKIEVRPGPGFQIARRKAISPVTVHSNNMGKKDRTGGKRKLQEEEEDESDEDLELQAEMAALASLRAEQEGRSGDEGESVPSQGKYLREAIEKCNGEFEEIPFKESMTICEFGLDPFDEHDDLAREMAFYNQSLLAVRFGRDRLKALGIPTQRPHDYFAENVKTDGHMAKIKDRLILEEKKMDAFEQRKMRDENRKFAKQKAALLKQEKSKKVKGEIEDTKKGWKGRDGDADDERRGSRGHAAGARDNDEKSDKRKGYDKKYGHGGKDAKRRKLSDKKSLNDLSDYSPRGGKNVKRESHMRQRSKNKKPNRPGKSTRDAKRNK